MDHGSPLIARAKKCAVAACFALLSVLAPVMAPCAEEAEYRVNPEILGGLVLRSGDKVVDGSVRGDLAALSNRLR